MHKTRTELFFVLNKSFNFFIFIFYRTDPRYRFLIEIFMDDPIYLFVNDN